MRDGLGCEQVSATRPAGDQALEEEVGVGADQAVEFLGLPDGVLDFTTDALAQPDAHWSEPVAWSRAAWLGGGAAY